MNKSKLEKLPDCRRAETANVHRPAADEMVEPLKELSGAVSVHAVGHRFAGLVYDRMPAGRTLFRIMKDLLFAAPLFEHRSYNLRDYVAGSFNDDHIADANIFS